MHVSLPQTQAKTERRAHCGSIKIERVIDWGYLGACIGLWFLIYYQAHGQGSDIDRGEGREVGTSALGRGKYEME